MVWRGSSKASLLAVFLALLARAALILPIVSNGSVDGPSHMPFAGTTVADMVSRQPRLPMFKRAVL